MTAPMPKDNEVDEKVMPVAWIVTNGGESCEPWLEYEQSEVDALPAVCIAEPLYSAATVAELRAEVERLREANQLYSFAMNTAGIDELKRRADAAERRVGELEAEVARQASSRKIAEDRATELELKEKMLASGWLDEANAGYLTGDALIDCATTNRQSVFFQCANALTGADPT